MRSVVRVKEVLQEKRAKTVLHIRPIYTTDGVDLMFKQKDFYAVYLEDKHLWSKDQQDFIELIDRKLEEYCQKKVDAGEYVYVSEGHYTTKNDERVVIDYVKYSDTQQLGVLNKWMNTVPRNFRYNQLDTDLTQRDQVKDLTWSDYRSKTLEYDIKKGSIKAYNRMMSELYSPENREKLEWAIGSVFVGDSKRNDKMIAIYGSPGTGKSTVLEIIKGLFKGYWNVFVASALASKSNIFSTASFKDNPLVAIQDDGSLARIETSTLNELISHAEMEINEKNVKQYTIKPNAILFLATNDPIDIHDTDEGIVRRLLDVYPTGKIIPYAEYCELEEQVKHEYGAIAYHCMEVYKKLGRKYYQHYTPEEMIQRTNYTYNFMLDKSFDLAEMERVRLVDLYAMYRNYFEEAGLKFPLDRIKFERQAEKYFREVIRPNPTSVAGLQLVGFKSELFDYKPKDEGEEEYTSWLTFNSTKSLFDEQFANYPAMYGKTYGDKKGPIDYWKNCKTKLSDLDTSKLHFVNVDICDIVIDFDLKGEDGKRSYEKNFEEARLWPETYAELSQSGSGIHLHYKYIGDDVEDLAEKYDEFIDIKVFKGNMSLRRKLTLCNAIPIATIDGTNLPKKEKKKKGDQMLNQKAFETEKELRSFIERCLKKKHHSHTKPEVDYIKSELDKYYESGKSYDIRDMRPKIMNFAANSTNQSDLCLKLVNQMHFCSDDAEEDTGIDLKTRTIVFFDVEVFPNLFILNWKYQGDDKVSRMVNPTIEEITNFVNQYALIGFNNRRYDNHILYARMVGKNNQELYETSQKIISGKSQNAMTRNAYKLSYTDVYDFSTKKQSLKKWEIELGIHHQELGLPWDQPVPEEMWEKVAEYCDNDVIATEAVFNACHADFVAREILADISGLTVNDTTNSHTQQIIFGNDQHPQSSFIYTDLSTIFPGYTFDAGHSLYRGEDPGEGGYVYAEPGIYYNVALLDVASMHPTSLEQLEMFGPHYTKNFSAIKQARIAIKHGEFDEAGKMFDGKLAKYLTNKDDADALAYALKIAINSVYGLTSANFDNRCRDPRNVDNIVAKRGALFMINLKHEVQDRGFTVAHIKTDSIKIPNATPEIIQFVMDYGQQYGYTFEHEATYKKMCLVNNAVYIAQYDGGKHDGEWTATGAEFQHPFIFKDLFSHEEFEFRDFCETKTVVTGDLYLDMNENLEDGEHNYKFVGRAGSFVPIAPGKGGGELMVLRNEKYVSATGAKGWRWLEAEDVKALHKEDDMDKEYFDKLVNDAVDHINEFGSFEQFISDDPINFGLSRNEDHEDSFEPREDFMNKPE